MEPITRSTKGFCQGARGAVRTSRIPILLDAPREVLAVDRVSITEQVPRSRIVREGLDDLAGGPDGRGVIRDVDVEEFAAVVAEHDEDEEQAEGEGRDHEEVDGDDVSGMRGEKGAPRRRRPRRRPVHVLGDGQLGDVVAEQGEFRLDAPAAPGRILARHASDQTANLGVEPRAADRVGPGLPPPVELEALAVPGQDGRGLNDDETGPPARPQAGQPDPEDPVPTGEPGSGDRALKDPSWWRRARFSRAMAADPKSKARRNVQRPITKSMGHPGIRHDGLNRDSTRSAMEEMEG